MTFKIVKPTTVPARGSQLLQPVEKLNIAMNMLGRVQGDPLQSAVRVGELVDAGVLQLDPSGLLIPGPALNTAPANSGAFKNLLLNGQFMFWQRANSRAAAATARYTADRWGTNASSWNIAPSREGFPPGHLLVPGDPLLYHRCTVTAGAGGASSFAILYQPIENVWAVSGKVTISFWAKADTARPISLELVQNFGTGGSASVDSLGVKQFMLGTTWQKIVHTVTLPSTLGKTFGSNNNLLFYIWLSAGTGYAGRTASLPQQTGVFDVSQVQMERGDRATDFERLDPAIELVMLKRYYEQSYPNGVFPGQVFAAGRVAQFVQGVSGLLNQTSVPFSVTKRGTPSVTIYHDGTGAAGSISQDDGSSVGVSNVTIGDSSMYVTWNNTAGRYGGSFHYTADAEI